MSLGIENVVNHTFEIKGVIGIRHQVIFIGALKLEAMCDSPFWASILSTTAEVHKTLIVP